MSEYGEWKSIETNEIYTALSGYFVARFHAKADRDRAIAEHNACRGFPTEALEAGAIKKLVDVLGEIATVTGAEPLGGEYFAERAQRIAQEALAALKRRGSKIQ